MRSCSLFTLGTPDERSWPGVTDLPDYKKRFPKWVKNTLTTVVPRLADCQGDQGHDLLKVSSLSCHLHYIQWRIFAKIQLSTFEYKVWATLGANGPTGLRSRPPGRGGGAPSRLSKTFEFLYQFLTIFQHSKMQLYISKCHNM